MRNMIEGDVMLVEDWRSVRDRLKKPLPSDPSVKPGEAVVADHKSKSPQTINLVRAYKIQWEDANEDVCLIVTTDRQRAINSLKALQPKYPKVQLWNGAQEFSTRLEELP